MTIAVGIFDLFTYTIPGSLYLTFLGYLAARLGWLDPGVVASPGLLLVIGVVLLSYLLGYLAYPLGAVANRAVPRRRRRDPREEFLRRTPAAHGRNYVQADRFLLISAVQLHDKDVAAEVTRLHAVGLMLRNSALPLALGSVAAIVELILGSRPVLAVGCAVLLAAGFFSLLVQGRRLGHWSHLKRSSSASGFPTSTRSVAWTGRRGQRDRDRLWPFGGQFVGLAPLPCRPIERLVVMPPVHLRDLGVHRRTALVVGEPLLGGSGFVRPLPAQHVMRLHQSSRLARVGPPAGPV